MRPFGALQMCRSGSGGGCRWSTDGGLRLSARGAAELVGSRPTASSFLACPRKEPKKGARGSAPATPAPPPVGLRPKSAAPSSRISGRVYSIPPAAAPRAQCLCPRASGTVPRVPIGEARPLLRGAQRPRGGGKLRGYAAHARRARERPERALFSAVCPRRAIRLHLLGAPAT